MTVRLEELLAAAVGDDPWYHPNYGEIRTKHPAELRLIALAPDAVRLLIDMGKALAELEWSSEDIATSEEACPECFGVKLDGHRDGCEYAALLARLDRLGNTT